MINVASLSDIWKFNVTGKTFAGTRRIHIRTFWVNSGFIYYNLDNLRKRSPDLFKCADKVNPCDADDSWHTLCNKGMMETVPYRYNVEFLAMIHKRTRPRGVLFEENHTVFYHLKDGANHPFYTIKRNELKDLEYAKQLKNSVLPIYERLYDIREWVDSELKSIKPANNNTGIT